MKKKGTKEMKKKEMKKKRMFQSPIRRSNILENFGRSGPIFNIGVQPDIHKSALEQRARKNLESSRTKLKELKRRRRTGDVSPAFRL